ncbi:MAG: hypothetical protein ACSHYA_00715 [Opitutaceae bacterium]
MEFIPIIAAVVAGFLVLFASFRFFFECRDDFFDAIRHWFTPDIISLFRGEWAEDQWNELKLFFWLGLSAFAAYIAYTSTQSLLL